MEAEPLKDFSLEAYLSLEEESGVKYEYHDGTVVAMAGGTIEQGLISGNIFGELKLGLRGHQKPCRAINGEVKLHIASFNKYLYPDAMDICGPLQRAPQHQDAIINPTIIVEVLSAFTERYDRGDKFFFYRQIPTLKAYILIDQYSPSIETYNRIGDLWQITRTTGLDKSLAIEALNLEIPLSAIYEGVVWE